MRRRKQPYWQRMLGSLVVLMALSYLVVSVVYVYTFWVSGNLPFLRTFVDWPVAVRVIGHGTKLLVPVYVGLGLLAWGVFVFLDGMRTQEIREELDPRKVSEMTADLIRGHFGGDLRRIVQEVVQEELKKHERRMREGGSTGVVMQLNRLESMLNAIGDALDRLSGPVSEIHMAVVMSSLADGGEGEGGRPGISGEKVLSGAPGGEGEVIGNGSSGVDGAEEILGEVEEVARAGMEDGAGAEGMVEAEETGEEALPREGRSGEIPKESLAYRKKRGGGDDEVSVVL